MGHLLRMSATLSDSMIVIARETAHTMPVRHERRHLPDRLRIETDASLGLETHSLDTVEGHRAQLLLAQLAFAQLAHLLYALT